MPITAHALIGLYHLAGAVSRLGVLVVLCYALILLDLPAWLQRHWELGDLISLILAGLTGGRLARHLIWRALYRMAHEPSDYGPGTRAAGQRANDAGRRHLKAWLCAADPLVLDRLVGSAGESRSR